MSQRYMPGHSSPAMHPGKAHELLARRPPDEGAHAAGHHVDRVDLVGPWGDELPHRYATLRPSEDHTGSRMSVASVVWTSSLRC